MILRRDFVKFAAAGLVDAGRSFSAPPRRPNIIVMLADDMGFSDLACYGSEIRTPHIDSLAQSGVRFTHFRNTARCCPSRSSLLTGLYAHQTGIGHMANPRPGLPGYQGDLNRSCVTIAQVLKGAGYQTMMSGKWHVTPNDGRKHNWPLQRGFDRYYGIIAGASSYYQPWTLTRDNDPIEPEGSDYYLTDEIGRNAAAYIEDAARRPDPFFLYVAFTAPHWPLHAFESDIERYRGRYRDGWDALRAERRQREIRMGLVEAKWGLTPRDEEVPAWKDAPDREWQQRRMEVYAAQIDREDRNVGSILDALRRTGRDQDTLIMFLADNGACAEDLPAGILHVHSPHQARDGRPMRPGNDPSILPGGEDTFASYGIAWANASNTPFRRYKHWVHEGGIASPLIARWPGGIDWRGAITHESGHIIDVMATCVDLAGARYPEQYDGERILPLEGRSLVPAFHRKKIARSGGLYWEHEGNRAMVDGRWKLVSRFPNRWELYDLEADRCEMRDLSSSDSSRVERMVGQYGRWAERCNVRPWDEVSKIPETPPRRNPK
ncbi:MAG: arylsulfatase [Bryobacteraceae bacterium]|jgi:arylsulfatase